MGFRYRRALRWWSGRNGPGVPVAVFVGLFGATTYALTPGAPGRDAVIAHVAKRLSDQNYDGCNAARSNGHENIGFWEPSYRPAMDGDDDGFACEPIRGRGGWLGN